MRSKSGVSGLVSGLDDSALFVGGRLCLDFVNTLCNRLGRPLEVVPDLGSLNRWLGLAHAAYGDSAEAWVAGGEDSLIRAVELRTALRALVDCILERREPAGEAIGVVNALLATNPVHEVLEFGGGSYRRRSVPEEERDSWLVAVARDTVDLLTASDLSLLRECECETCVRVFYDTTKNHTRRWCIDLCGGRIKAASYYRRKRLRAATANQESGEASILGGGAPL